MLKYRWISLSSHPSHHQLYHKICYESKPTTSRPGISTYFSNYATIRVPSNAVFSTAFCRKNIPHRGLKSRNLLYVPRQQKFFDSPFCRKLQWIVDTYKNSMFKRAWIGFIIFGFLYGVVCNMWLAILKRILNDEKLFTSCNWNREDVLKYEVIKFLFWFQFW